MMNHEIEVHGIEIVCDDVEARMQEANCNLESLHILIKESAGAVENYNNDITMWEDFDKHTDWANGVCSTVADFSMPDCKLSLYRFPFHTIPFQPNVVV